MEQGIVEMSYHVLRAVAMLRLSPPFRRQGYLVHPCLGLYLFGVGIDRGVQYRVALRSSSTVYLFAVLLYPDPARLCEQTQAIGDCMFVLALRMERVSSSEVVAGP